jgi:hypothetical protein
MKCQISLLTGPKACFKGVGSSQSGVHALLPLMDNMNACQVHRLASKEVGVLDRICSNCKDRPAKKADTELAQ